MTAETERGSEITTGVVLWIACGAIPCLHKALGDISLCKSIKTCSDLFRTSLPLRSDAEIPPWRIKLLCFLASPGNHTQCYYRHNRMTIACFMFVVSMGTTLRRFTDLQQLPGRSRTTAEAVNRRARLVFASRWSVFGLAQESAISTVVLSENGKPQTENQPFRGYAALLFFAAAMKLPCSSTSSNRSESRREIPDSSIVTPYNTSVTAIVGLR